MRDYLVCYDYGTGGLWWWVEAPNADAINAAFRDLIVFEQPPAWWNDDANGTARRVALSDMDDDVLNQFRR